MLYHCLLVSIVSNKKLVYLQTFVLLFVMCLFFFSPMATFKILPLSLDFSNLTMIWKTFFVFILIWVSELLEIETFSSGKCYVFSHIWENFGHYFLKLFFPLSLSLPGIPIICDVFPQVPKALIFYPKVFSLSLWLDNFYWSMFQLTDSSFFC